MRRSERVFHNEQGGAEPRAARCICREDSLKTEGGQRTAETSLVLSSGTDEDAVRSHHLPCRCSPNFGVNSNTGVVGVSYFFE